MRSMVLPFERLRCSRVCLIGGLRTYTCKRPTHPDPQCEQINPKCYHVKDECGSSRDYLSSKIPLDKHMLEMQMKAQENEFEPKCCVSRLVHRAPADAKMIMVKSKKRPPFRSMWEPPRKPHEQKYCIGMLPRFDEMYYYPSDKKRCFQRTWIECPPIKERLKKVCCLDGIEPEEIERRIKVPCPPTTCTFDYARMRHICQKVEPNLEGKCYKTFWPCCKPARCPPTCSRGRAPLSCKRLRPPRKSFSETREWKRPLRSRECNRKYPTTCESIREAEHRKQFKIRPMCSPV